MKHQDLEPYQGQLGVTQRKKKNLWNKGFIAETLIPEIVVDFFKLPLPF
jgi:hypothetical protein